MIKILGKKRIFFLLVFVTLNVVLVAGLYSYLMPQKSEKERELRGVRGRVSTLQNDLERLQIEFEQLEYQQTEFELLKEDGFFSAQNRREAEKVLEAMQQESGVISAVANIKSGTFVDDEEAAKADHRILSSPILVRVEALDDIDVYKYLSLINNRFPGHLSLKTLDIRRQNEITAAVLRTISSGKNPSLVLADIELTWRTMIPVADVDQGGVQQ